MRERRRGGGIDPTSAKPPTEPEPEPKPDPNQLTFRSGSAERSELRTYKTRVRRALRK